MPVLAPAEGQRRLFQSRSHPGIPAGRHGSHGPWGQLITPERLPVLLFEAPQAPTHDVKRQRPEAAALRKRIKDLEQQIDRLYGALREGTVTDTASFRAQLSQVEREREEAVAHLSGSDSDIPESGRHYQTNRQQHSPPPSNAASLRLPSRSSAVMCAGLSRESS